MCQAIVDLRLVNYCNNNCLYCLEKSLRKLSIWTNIDKRKLKNKSISIYGWNIFVCNGWKKILKDLVDNNIKIFSIQTNGYWFKDEDINFLRNIWVRTINLKLHSLIPYKDYILAWRPKNYYSVKNKVRLILKLLDSGFIVRVNYFVTKLNLIDLYKEFCVLYKIGIKDFDFIGPHPFDEVWDYKDIILIDYMTNENKAIFNKFLEKLSLFMKKDKNLKINFKKFPCSFFYNKNKSFCNLQKTVIEQISEEDKEILNWKVKPYCYPKRCRYCFLQDICSILNEI